MPKIVLTGGGTAGHVTPNIALLPYLRKKGYEIHYIGTREGLEYELITAQPDIVYHEISAGKLRRYLDIKNLTDPFKVIKGYRQSLAILRETAPDVLFSKGGFVSVPAVKAAGKLKIPVVIHESDISPGLATRLCAPAAKRICLTFKEAGAEIQRGKGGCHRLAYKRGIIFRERRMRSQSARAFASAYAPGYGRFQRLG